MGYDKTTWDNDSNEEQQPWSAIKYWTSLTDTELEAVKLLGYNQITWDNKSGKEPRPEAHYKYWDELTSCGKGENLSIMHPSCSELCNHA